MFNDAEKNALETDEIKENKMRKRLLSLRGHKKAIGLFGAVIVAAVITAVFFLLPGAKRAGGSTLRVLDFGKVINGVHVEGVDISGMTGEEARAATAGLQDSILGAITISFDVNGEVMNLSAAQAGLDTDYADVIEYAVSYGHTGALEQRAQAAYAASSGFVDFKVHVRAEPENVRAAIIPLKQLIDKAPVDAAAAFLPNGYFSDGTAFDPQASGKENLVYLEGDAKPNPLRYQYYRTDEYVRNYIPKDAYIARFLYSKEESGLIVDIEAVAQSVMSAAEAGDYSVITAPVQILEASVKQEALVNGTRLLSSWTSSYESHDDAERNFNVEKLSGLINGVVIAPGETWSINAQAGPRTYENGWKGAAGINRGAFVTEPGGGVCQISSTTYNAALRAGLEIVESNRHSIISNYMPIGLDATISTEGRDLKLRNPYATPVYIVSYINKRDKNVTVEIYGPPLVHATYGEVILNFTSSVIERTEMPDTIMHYKASQTPDGKPIEPGATKRFIIARRGTKVQVYIHYLSLSGEEIASEEYYVTSYPKITGHTYINDIPQEDADEQPEGN